MGAHYSIISASIDLASQENAADLIVNYLKTPILYALRYSSADQGERAVYCADIYVELEHIDRLGNKSKKWVGVHSMGCVGALRDLNDAQPHETDEELTVLDMIFKRDLEYDKKAMQWEPSPMFPKHARKYWELV